MRAVLFYFFLHVYFLEKRGKGGWLFACDLRKNLSIHLNFCVLELFCKHTIAQPKFSACGVDLDKPKRAECTLFCAAIPERIRARFEHGWPRELDPVFPSPAISFCGGKQFSPFLEMDDSSFYPWHRLQCIG